MMILKLLNILLLLVDMLYSKLINMVDLVVLRKL